MRVYIHGAGRTGRDAWPNASPDDALFAEFDSALSLDARVDEIAILTLPAAVVIAHSAGAVPSVLAVSRRKMSPRALVLVEPALYDVARGAPAIERHIERMTVARRRADAGDLFGFWEIVRPMMFGAAAERDAWDAEHERASRFAAIDLPWGHGIAARALTGIPTLVVTGAWNDEYEAIGAALADAGATHVALAGYGHRPQDHPHFEDTVRTVLG